MSTGYIMGKGWQIENTSLRVYFVEIFLCWAVRLLLCFEIHSRERPSINTKPLLLCSFLNKTLRMISASFAVLWENVPKRFRKRPLLAWLQCYGFILFALSLEMGHVMAWPKKGTACSLRDPLCEPVWVGTDAEKISLSWGSFTEAKRELRSLAGGGSNYTFEFRSRNTLASVGLLSAIKACRLFWRAEWGSVWLWCLHTMAPCAPSTLQWMLFD